MRAPLAFIRSLSSKLSVARRSTSSMVVPLVEESWFSQQVTAKFDTLKSSKCDVGSASWLCDVFGASVATQMLAQEFLDIASISLTDREMIEEYLEDNIELLDACNGLLEKMGIIQDYVYSIRGATRMLQGRSDPNVPTSRRAQEVLGKCNKVQKQCAELDKCGLKLCRMMRQKMPQDSNVWYDGRDFDIQEVVRVSREAAFVACHNLHRALSFKSKPRLMTVRSESSTPWLSIMDEDIKHQNRPMSWMMNELQQLVTVQQLLHDQVKLRKGSIHIDYDSVSRNCERLEKEMKALKENNFVRTSHEVV
ncbi:hypothetical protein Cgig2_015121 [Carnegiea gigantea]|uniref:Uncharacterized protein n=1 Tax=Carnegiea gigantea TaxID=171969 RepID=A0A9Q1KQM0_9CARY|nr:hypothetical protein Cgig2_015121 [Carnegiea gigantea]